MPVEAQVRAWDILVVGGGVAGLAQACALADALGADARIAVLETVIKRVEEGMRRWGIDVPPHVDEIEAKLRKERADAERV